MHFHRHREYKNPESERAAARRRPDKGDEAMAHVVFICTANICRSPMAEGIFRHKADLTGRGDLTTASMGIHGLPDEPASEPAAGRVTQ